MDGVQNSSDLSISATSFCPYHFAVGEHREIMVDFDKKKLLSSDYLPKAQISMCRLILSNIQAIQLYLSEAKKNIELQNSS